MSAEQLVQLDPAKVLADDNSRFNLKRARTDSLKASILESGGVLVPVEVEPLSPAQNGFTHRLTSGYYRHAAVLALNAEQNAGLTLPAVVRKVEPGERLRHQLMENIERENMSPMDAAVSIKRLMDASVARGEIRRIFARPTGKKGTEMQPASNAWVNIVLRFLELPKTIQEKIHDGRIGVEAAYELGKVPPDRRAAVIERAEGERQKQLELEAKDEEKYLAAEKKMTEAVEEEKAAVSRVDKANMAVKTAEALTLTKTEALRTIQKEPYLTMDDKQKGELKERLKVAEVDLKEAQKAEKDAKNDLAKLLNKAKSAGETALEQKAKLEQARNAVKKPGAKKSAKPLGKSDVQKAAAAEGVNTGAVPLNASEIKQAVKDVTKMKEFPRVVAIANAFAACFGGVTTTKQLGIELAQITGEAGKGKK